MVAMVNFSNPLLWAVLIGWIMSVVLHEFAHGLVAHWGGDYTVRERGGLTLNPIQYIDPVMSILLPIAIFLIGGIPLPPLDGFGIISPYMNPNTREKFMTPPLSFGLFFALFLLAGPLGLIDRFFRVIIRLLIALGFDGRTIRFFIDSYNGALFGAA